MSKDRSKEIPIGRNIEEILREIRKEIKLFEPVQHRDKILQSTTWQQAVPPPRHQVPDDDNNEIARC